MLWSEDYKSTLKISCALLPFGCQAFYLDGYNPTTGHHNCPELQKNMNRLSFFCVSLCFCWVGHSNLFLKPTLLNIGWLDDTNPTTGHHNYPGLQKMLSRKPKLQSWIKAIRKYKGRDQPLNVLFCCSFFTLLSIGLDAPFRLSFFLWAPHCEGCFLYFCQVGLDYNPTSGYHNYPGLQ